MAAKFPLQRNQNRAVLHPVDVSNFYRSPTIPSQDLGASAKSKQRPGPKRLSIAKRPLSFPPPVACTQRSYSVKYKLRVLSYLQHAEIPYGPTKTRKPTLKETSVHYKIPIANISRWKHEEPKLLKMSGAQNRSRGAVRKWPRMESRLYARFREQRAKGKIVRRGFFRKEGKAIFVQEYPEESLFRFSNGWFTGFLNWYNISLRVSTNKASKLPKDLYGAILSWTRFNRRNSQVRPDDEFGLGDQPAIVGRYRLRNVCNMDQTPLPFEFLSGQTYTTKGEKTVWVKGAVSGWDKRQATLQLTVFADGENHVCPLIFFRGQGLGVALQKERSLYDPRVIVKFNPTAYANSENMIEWLEEQVIPVLEGQPTLLALDLFGGHKTDEVLDTLKAHDITISVIPAGCTGIVQPLDISINRPFKDILKEKIDEHELVMDKEEETILGQGRKLTGSKVGRRRVMTTWAVGDAWEEFCRERKEVIKRSFRVVGLSLPIDGSCDNEMSLKGLDMEQLTADLKDWHISCPGAISGEGRNGDEGEISEAEDHNERVDYEFGPPRVEN